MNKQAISQLVKATAQRLGFDNCGIARAMPLDEDARRLERWLSSGMQGTMSYMERNFELRVDPTKLLPGAKSVITLMLNYFPKDFQPQELPQISKYAYGRDYHEVIHEKLGAFTEILRREAGDISIRGFVDSAPVLEKTWAVRSGLGWIGKNGNLLSKKQGSFYFLATLITDLELGYDNPFSTDHCGSCTLCIDHCPTEAILPEKVVDGSKCISYFTIELKDEFLPDDMKGKFDNRAFGCDICQDVCPWNRFSTPTKEKAFQPKPEIFSLTAERWENMEETEFRSIFKDSPLSRTKLRGMKRNTGFLKKK